MSPQPVLKRVVWTPCPQDAGRYALDGPQTFDPEQLNSLPSSQLEKLEEVLVANAGLYLEDMWPVRNQRVASARAFMWLTLRLKGLGLDWGDFDPHVRLTQFDPQIEMEDDDAGPPDSTAVTSSDMANEE